MEGKTGSRLQMFWKKGVLKNFEKLTEKHPSWSLFEIMIQVWGLQLYQKVTQIQVCSYWFWEIFTSTFFTEQLRATASEGLLLNSHFHVQPFRTALNSNFRGYFHSSCQWKLFIQMAAAIFCKNLSEEPTIEIIIVKKKEWVMLLHKQGLFCLDFSNNFQTLVISEERNNDRLFLILHFLLNSSAKSTCLPCKSSFFKSWFWLISSKISFTSFSRRRAVKGFY